MEAYIVPHIGGMKLQEVGTSQVTLLYTTLARSGGRDGRPLRGKSVRNVHGVLHKALSDATRWTPKPLLAVSPMVGVDPPARDDSVTREAWSADEVRRFLEAAANDRHGPVWRLVLATGVRRGELLRLTWEDVRELTVAIRRQVLTGRGQPLYVRETTKSRRERTVRIDEQTAGALRTWKVRQAEERLAFGPAYKTHGGLQIEAPWIVTEPDGCLVNPATLLRRWRALAVRAGVRPIPLHGARHTHATLSLAAGNRLDVVSRQLGHSSVAITADVYGHADDDALREAAERIARTFEGR